MRRCFRSSKTDSALFSSDYYALEASNFLQNRGIKVPEEISIAGFDDVTYATLARPKLTTVHQMVDGKARRAVEVLMHLIQDEPVQKIFRHCRQRWWRGSR